MTRKDQSHSAAFPHNTRLLLSRRTGSTGHTACAACPTRPAWRAAEAQTVRQFPKQIEAPLKKRILSRLKGLEKAEAVQVCYSVESGSRAWGFASTDSDFDVRFLYVRRPEWYTAINVERLRDVIELPIVDELDINGWDVRKAFQLFRKSNPPLLEWLQSPIVYRDKFGLATSMRELLPIFFNARACSYHYLSMARNNYRGYLKGSQVWRKKYFYLLRPLLAIRWMEQGLGIPPTEFTRMIEPTLETGSVTDAIAELLEAKRAGKELDLGPRTPPIHDFIEAELTRHEKEGGFRKLTRPAKGVEKLNALLRETLDLAWSEGGTA